LIDCRKKSREEPSHIRIIRAAAALRRHPIDVLRRVLDVARLAVDAILRIDHEKRIALFRLVAIDHFVDGGGAIEPRAGSPYSGRFRPIGIDGILRILISARSFMARRRRKSYSSPFAG
jgi:hypothetical protein